LKEPCGRKKQVQARGKPPRSEYHFFGAFAPFVQLIDSFNSTTGNAFLWKPTPSQVFSQHGDNARDVPHQERPYKESIFF
jgi:hypothetical protein